MENLAFQAGRFSHRVISSAPAGGKRGPNRSADFPSPPFLCYTRRTRLEHRARFVFQIFSGPRALGLERPANMLSGQEVLAMIRCAGLGCRSMWYSRKDRYAGASDAGRLAAYDQACSAYYVKRAGGRRDDNWTGQVARMMRQPLRPHMGAFLKSRGFKMPAA